MTGRESLFTGRVTAIRNALGLSRSIAKSGEEWSERAEAEFVAALAALDELARVGAERDELRAALTMLRDAWNAHFDACPQPRLDLPMPTADEIRSWMEAPSDTASA